MKNVNVDVNQRFRIILERVFNNNITAMAKATYISRSTIYSIIGEQEVAPGYDVLRKIAELSTPEISIVWLMTGQGDMLIPDKPAGGIPYFADLQVSAGRLEAIVKDAQPSGYIDLPNVSATALFPVVGCSMSPEINPGDVIGVSQVESWDIVDPDKVYLIITHEDRMIKHLAIDESDDSILWCLSPNYPKFRIYKNDIKYIYRVTFCGKLM